MRRRSGDTTVCMMLFSKAGKAWQKGFNILIANLSKDVLSRTDVNRKCAFCTHGQYSAEHYDDIKPKFSGQAFYKTEVILVKIWVSWHIKKGN